MTHLSLSEKLHSSLDDCPQTHSAQMPESEVKEFLRTFLGSGEGDVAIANTQNRSIILNEVCNEYQAAADTDPEITVKTFSTRYEHLPHSLKMSIFRQLEVQDYLCRNPALQKELEQSPWPNQGDTVRGYKVLEELGRGAMARAYLCLQPELGNRAVVLKISHGLPPIEASLLGRLSHPNIMPVHSVGFDETTHTTFLCMPYLGKSTLHDLVDTTYRKPGSRLTDQVNIAATTWITETDLDFLSENTLTETIDSNQKPVVEQILAIAIQLADALAAAHRGGVVHGDIKPSNVLLTPTGTPLLFDFNLGRSTITGEGVTGGTLEYMAPELLEQVVNGNAKSAQPPDEQTDIYSFGILLFELLTGRPPFAAPQKYLGSKQAAQFIYELHKQPTPVAREANPYANGSLSNLIAECIAFDRSKRPRSMDEVRSRLEKELSWPQFASRLAKRNKLKTALVATALIASSLFTGYHFATRPPLIERLFQRATAQQAVGDFQAALATLEQMKTAAPDDARAAFTQGKIYLKEKDYDAALDTFHQLFRKTNEPRFAEYVGYCLNLKREHHKAIVWYERVEKLGYSSASLCNNLGASYLIEPNGKTKIEQYKLAEQYARKAVHLDKDSLICRVNLIRSAKHRIESEPSYRPLYLQHHLNHVLYCNPQNAVVWGHILWCQIKLYEYGLSDLQITRNTIKHALKCGDTPVFKEITHSEEFRAFRNHAIFQPLRETNVTPVALVKNNHKFNPFIEPAM